MTGSSQGGSIMLSSVATKPGDEDLDRIAAVEKDTRLTFAAVK